MTDVTLRSPIKVNNADVTSLTFAEPTVKDLIAGDIVAKSAGETARMAAVLASMAGVPYIAFQDMKAKDFARVIDKTQHLVGNESPEVDGTS